MIFFNKCSYNKNWISATFLVWHPCDVDFSPGKKEAKEKMRFGHHLGPVGAIRARDFQLRDPMGGWITESGRDEAFRSFQFMGAVAKDMAIGCAITKTHHAMSAFAYAWFKGEFIQIRLGSRVGNTAEFADDPDSGRTELKTDRGAVVMESDGNEKHLIVNSESLEIELTFSEDSTETLRLCTPAGPAGWSYVQKVVAVDAMGSFTAAGVKTRLKDFAALAHHDYTTGFLRAETWWHWACVVGRLPDNRTLGLNVSCGTNESGYRENGCWLKGKWFALGGALFEFDHENIESDWRIYGTDGDFELIFSAGHGYHANGISPKMSSNFHQLFGNFNGWICIDAEKFIVKAQPGFTESQYMLW